MNSNLHDLDYMVGDYMAAGTNFVHSKTRKRSETEIAGSFSSAFIPRHLTSKLRYETSAAILVKMVGAW